MPTAEKKITYLYSLVPVGFRMDLQLLAISR